MFNRNFKKQKGLSLLEVVISIGVFVLVGVTISYIFNYSLYIYRAVVNKGKAVQEGQITREWIERDISQANCIYQATSQSIALKTPDWDFVRYHLSTSEPTTLVRSDCDTDYVLAKNIEDFNLKYYNINNQTTTIISEIKTVEINFTATKNDQGFRIYAVVAPDDCCQECRFARAYGGSGFDDPRSFQQTSDGGYVIVAISSSYGAGGDDFLMFKINRSGELEWTKTYGGTSNDQINAVQQTQDDGYILGGLTLSFGASYPNVNFLAVKTDSSGTIEWTKIYDAPTRKDLFCLIQTQDQGYLFGGHMLVRTDADGNEIWTQSYSGIDVRYIREVSDGFIVAGDTGSTYGAGSIDLILIKIDTSGNPVWARTYGNTSWDYFKAMQITADGYILGGYSGSFGIVNYLVVKTDSSGGVEWAKTYGGSGGEWLYDIEETKDGGYILGGKGNSFGDGGCLVIKTDSSGDVEWAKAYNKFDNYSRRIRQAQDEGYIITGYTFRGASSADVLFAKTDSSGNIDCCSMVQDVTSSVIPVDQTAAIITTSPTIPPAPLAITETSPGDIAADQTPLTKLICPPLE